MRRLAFRCLLVAASLWCSVPAANRHRLIVPFERPASPGAPDALVGTWDIVLDEG